VRRVTLDTNIYISALEFGGEPLLVLDMAIAGEIEVAISGPIVAEIERVLETKFGWQPQDILDAKVLVLTTGKWVEPKQTLDVVKEDPDDNRIVECAVEAGSQSIITHDKDLLRMGSYEGIKMMKVAEFLREEEGAPDR
jgi:putative PIN family toxin of toxin-antitoxin system